MSNLRSAFKPAGINELLSEALEKVDTHTHPLQLGVQSKLLNRKTLLLFCSSCGQGRFIHLYVRVFSSSPHRC